MLEVSNQKHVNRVAKTNAEKRNETNNNKLKNFKASEIFRNTKNKDKTRVYPERVKR